MLRRVFAFQRLDQLPQQFVSRNLRQTPNPAEFQDPPAEKSGSFSETINRRIAAPRPTTGTLIYLISFGIVAATTVGAFFGVAFLLLAHPKGEIVADLPIHHIGAEVSPPRSNTLPPSDSSAAAPAASGSSSERAAGSSDGVAAPPLSVSDWTSANTLPPSDSSAAAPAASGSSSERAAGSADGVTSSLLSVPDWTSAIPPKYLRAHRRGREARMTGTTADRLNHQELASLLAGRTLSPLSAMPWRRMRGGRHLEYTGRE